MKKYQSMHQGPTDNRDVLHSKKALEFKSFTEIKGEDSNRTQHLEVSPLDFVNFIPFLTKRLGLPFSVMIMPTEVENYAKYRRTKSKIATPKHSPKAAVPTTSGMSSSPYSYSSTDKHFCLEPRYSSNQLIQIHYYGKHVLPRELFKMIASIIQLYPYLSNITIANGLDMYGIYEISKLLAISRVNEVCLEHLNIKNAHYQLLLSEASNLSYLSLSKCTINDEIVEKMMAQLKHPLTASKTLLALNLSCNLITDSGARFIGEALRTNRCLQYLNLTGNMITDNGATFIFTSLMKFPLYDKEKYERDKTYVQYSLQKVKLMTKYIKQSTSQQNKELESKIARKVGKKSKKGDDLNADTDTVTNRSVDPKERQKAKTYAENVLGIFQHPYDKTNIVQENGIEYCLGNNTLCYLNMAYNYISVVSIRKLLNVLTYQKDPARTPKGLMRVIVEGNPLPADCAELSDLSYVSGSLLNISQKGQKSIRKAKSTKFYN